jgi:hypothetical protein
MATVWCRVTRLPVYLLFVVQLGLLSCDSNRSMTTKSPYTSEQVSDLEIRGIRNDVEALRRLENHYSFQGMHEKSKEIHKKLVRLDDPVALDVEVDYLIIASEEAKRCQEKMDILNSARKMSVRIATIYQIKDTSTYESVKLVDSEIAKLKCG